MELCKLFILAPLILLLFGCSPSKPYVARLADSENLHPTPLEDSNKIEGKQLMWHGVETTRRIPEGALITVDDLTRYEIPDNMVTQDLIGSPLPCIGRRARHNISAGTKLRLFEIWWEPRSAHEGSDLIQNEIKLARARWHEKSDFLAEKALANVVNGTSQFEGPKKPKAAETSPLDQLTPSAPPNP